MSHKIIPGDNVATLKTFADNSIDSIITDPPYGIEFLGKDWDSNTGAVETWQECLRVLKPGGYLLAFSAARTYHHLATNIESVGFEIRDQLMWIYASGFPKAQDIGKAIQRRQGVEKYKEIDLDAVTECAGRTGSGGGINRMMKKLDAKGDQQDGVIKQVIPTSPEAKQWAGWKTALKPAHEPIVMARKPFKGSTIDNVLEHGVGALNIDATRIPLEHNVRTSTTPTHTQSNSFNTMNIDQQNTFEWTGDPVGFVPNEQGRYPANVLGEIPDYQKYFYCPKVSRRERHCGFESTYVISTEQMVAEMGGRIITNNRIWTPDLGEFYVHGLKHEYEEWCKKNKRDPLAHIETLSNYSQGDVKNHPLWDPSIGTNLQRLKHKIMEHNRDLGKNKDPLQHLGRQNHNDGWHCEDPKRKDPLAHIPTNPEGMYAVDGTGVQYNSNKYKSVGNNHPTVKPVALMRWLIQLVTPAGGRVLDPFAGSGSTGMAAVELGHEFIGCELDPNYVAIANRRIAGWNTPDESDQANTFNQIFEEK